MHPHYLVPGAAGYAVLQRGGGCWAEKAATAGFGLTPSTAVNRYRNRYGVWVRGKKSSIRGLVGSDSAADFCKFLN
jgi:hypothetical protein